MIRLLVLFLIMFGSVALSADSAYADLDDVIRTECDFETRFQQAEDANALTIPLTESIVRCVRSAVDEASIIMLGHISDYLRPIAITTFALALTFFAIRILGGERQIFAGAIALLIRIAIVGAFSYNLGGMASAFFSLYDELITLVVGGYSPWVTFDQLIGRLLGFAPGISLLSGLAGVFGGAAVSSTYGLFLFGLGMTALISLIFFMLRVLYTYLMSYLTIGFLICISPIVIIPAVFKLQETYAEKWLHKLITTMILPMLLFAFLWMTLGVFHNTINTLFNTLGSNTCYNIASEGPIACFGGSANAGGATCPAGGPNIFSFGPAAKAYCPPDLRPYWKVNMAVSSWMTPTDPALTLELLEKKCSRPSRDRPNVLPTEQEKRQCMERNKYNPPVPSNMAANQRFAAEAMSYTTPGIDFGPNHVSIMEELIFVFITMFIMVSLMMSAFDLLVPLANSIGQGRLSMAAGQGSGIESQAKGALQAGPAGMGRRAESMNSAMDRSQGKSASEGFLNLFRASRGGAG